MEVLERHEKVHHAAHGGDGHAPNANNKRIAILISFMACLLAIIEIGGNSNQNTSLAANIEASNLWAFFQAKTIRMTSTKSSAELLETLMPSDLPADKAKIWNSRIAEFKAAAKRFDSEPETGEGRKELMVKAKAAEVRYNRALHAYHLFEYSAAALQIGIVLASSAAVTGVITLAYMAGGLAIIASVIAGIAWQAPTLIHL